MSRTIKTMPLRVKVVALGAYVADHDHSDSACDLPRLAPSALSFKGGLETSRRWASDSSVLHRRLLSHGCYLCTGHDSRTAGSSSLAA